MIKDNRARADLSAIPRPMDSLLTWPSVVSGQQGTLYALAYQLRDSQWWSAEEIRSYQYSQALVLLRHAVSSVPFYRERLQPALLQGGISEDDWQQIPLLSRAEAQQFFVELQSLFIPKAHGDVFEKQSSGSTGQPVCVKAAAVSNIFFAALNLRLNEWAGLEHSSAMAYIRMLDGKPPVSRADKKIPWAATHHSGPLYTLDITTPLHEQLRWLEDCEADYLMTYPSNLAALLDAYETSGSGLKTIRQILTMAEILHPSMRAKAASLGVPVYDCYSSTEVGIIALQCPQSDEYHLQSESLLVEVLDENNQPCQPGETGRVVVTDLHNFIMPLIRYEIGDYAVVGEPCACGRGLPVVSRIIGRERNRVTLPDGERIWPIGWSSTEMKKIAPIRQIQMIQKSLHRIEVKLVVDRVLLSAEEQRLTRLFQEKLSHPFDLDYHYCDHIPRSAGGKFEDIICQLD